MIFRIRDVGEESDNSHLEKRQSLINFISIILGTYLDFHEYKTAEKIFKTKEPTLGLKELAEWESKYISANARSIGDGILSLVKTNENDNRNTVTYDDLRECLAKYLTEDGIIHGKGGGQLSWAIRILTAYDPDKGKDPEKAKAYDLYSKKIGVIFDSFRKYMNSNIKELIERKQSTDRIVDNSGEDKDSNTHAKGRDFNQIGKEEEYNLSSIINLPRDLCNYFFDAESDKISVKLDITKIYNIYLNSDIATRNSNRGSTYLIGNTVKLNDSDLDALDELIDTDYIMSYGAFGEKETGGFRSRMFKLLHDDSDEVRRVISDFFCLLVKCRYKMPVKGNPYLNNFDLFRTIKIIELDDFRRAIEGTTLIRDGYSEFLLLKDYNIKDIVKNNPKKSDKFSFTKSLSQSPTVTKPKSNMSVYLDTRLRSFLEKIVELGEQPCTTLYDKELIAGVNRETIKNEDIKLAKRLLGHLEEDVSFKERIKQFGAIGDLLNWNTKVNILNTSEAPEVTQSQLRSILNGFYTLDGGDRISNSERIGNLWKILKQVHDEIITLEDEQTGPKQSEMVFNYTTKYGVKVWEFNGIIIPKVERATQYFFVRVYNTSVVISSKKLDEGKFTFNGQPYVADSNGVKMEYMTNPNIEKMIEKIAPLETSKYELNALIGVDERYDADSITDWLQTNISKSMTKKKTVKQKVREEDLFGGDFIDGLGDADMFL